MKQVYFFSQDGFYSNVKLIPGDERIPENATDILWPSGTVKPKWDGAKWMEGASDEEIKAISAPPAVPSDSDRISAIENYILFGGAVK